MSEIIISNPKVFISYAWSSKEYQEKVLSLATDLIHDGIQVEIDRWSLKEGNDTYTFMEQSVTDPSITNVLILLDPQYEKKANDRRGGVGTETQIISPEIYNKVKQDKFLPVVFERGNNGEVPKPIYLKGLLHFDLSKPENYDEEYQRLVKRLYGIEILKKPELGNKPAWLDSEVIISTKIRSSFEVLKSNIPSEEKKRKFDEFLSNIHEQIINFKENKSIQQVEYDDYIKLYAETQNIRDEFLLLMRYIYHIENGEKLVAASLESVCEELARGHGIINEIQKTLLHEIFIYVIAIYYKNKKYDAISYTINRTYFVNDSYNDKARSFDVFYEHNENFEKAVNKRDNKTYYSGVAKYWIDNININTCNKNEFVFADILLHNASIFIQNYEDGWYWFPITYIYGGHGNGLMKTFSIKLISKEHLKETATIFGYSNISDFEKKFSEVEERLNRGNMEKYRFNSCFEFAPLMNYYIKAEELGTRN